MVEIKDSVIKFGGTSVANESIKIEEIVKIEDPRYVVVSAPGKTSPVDAKVTDILIDLNEKGYYAEEGLDVTFNLGSPETNPVKMVASEADQFGVLGGPDTLLVARSKGQPLVAIAIIHRNSDFPVILTLNESGLTKLEDLQNKKIGFFYGHISTDVLHSLLNKYNITREEVDVGFDYSQLIAKKIDAQWAFTVTAGLNLPEKGIQVNVISPKDYGINTHGYTIFTTEKMIKENPEIVERFLRATIRGIKATLENPSEAADILAKKDNKINRNLEYKRNIRLHHPQLKEKFTSLPVQTIVKLYHSLLDVALVS